MHLSLYTCLYFADVFTQLYTPVNCRCFLQLRTAVSTHRSLYTYAAHVKYIFAHVLSSDESDDDHGDND